MPAFPAPQPQPGPEQPQWKYEIHFLIFSMPLTNTETFPFSPVWAVTHTLLVRLSLPLVCDAVFLRSAPGSIPSISEETAREAFVLFASSNCCYSKGPAKDGVITSMEAFNTYRVCDRWKTTSQRDDIFHYKRSNKGTELCFCPPLFIQYRLETFTESRSTEWSHVPYHGTQLSRFTQWSSNCELSSNPFHSVQ